MAELLSDADIDAIELNVSCPNVKKGCVAFGNSPAGISEITSKVKNTAKSRLLLSLLPMLPILKK